MFPGRGEHESIYAHPDFEKVHRELPLVGVTLKLLHGEYLDGCTEAGEPAMGYDRFCNSYQQHVLVTGLTSRVGHREQYVVMSALISSVLLHARRPIASGSREAPMSRAIHEVRMPAMPPASSTFAMIWLFQSAPIASAVARSLAARSPAGIDDDEVRMTMTYQAPAISTEIGISLPMRRGLMLSSSRGLRNHVEADEEEPSPRPMSTVNRPWCR